MLRNRTPFFFVVVIAIATHASHDHFVSIRAMRAAILFFLSALVSGTAAGGVRVALYVGLGATAPSFANYSIALNELVNSGEVASYAELNSTDIDSGRLSLTDFDTLLVPGGMSTTESTAIGALGLANILEFVASGGGYVGVCAGAYLAWTAECCDRAVTGYCNGTTGCQKTAWSLGLAPLASANPWDRGHGLVNITFTREAVDMLRLPYAPGENVTIMYWQGPILDRSWHGAVPGVNFDVLAEYESEIHTDWPSYTTGVMVHTPAVTTVTYGRGRVLLSSPHPEETTPIILPIIRGYVQWTGRAI